MATIKRCTDIPQSKKLAEILPLESADFHFSANQSPQGYLEKPIWGNPEYADYNAFPCWSLSALISIIPQELFDGEYIINITEGRNHKWIISYDPPYDISSYLSVSDDNIIDCCVGIIIKLKERNLL